MSTPEQSENPSSGPESSGGAPVSRAETAGLESALKHLADTLRLPAKRPKAPLVSIGTFVVAVLGLIGIVISGVGLYQSVKSSVREDQRARFDSYNAQILQLDSTFVEKPEFQKYFWEGVPATAAPDENIRRTVEAIAELRVDSDEYIYRELVNMGIAPSDGRFVLRTSDGPTTARDDWLAWSETFVDHFRNSPAMCDIVTDPESKKAYGVAFINAIAAAQVCPEQ